MFWVALSTLLMVMTGQGDDTFVFREFLENLRDNIETHVTDPGRRARALAIVDDTAAGFKSHRERVNKIGECVEQNDRTYKVSVADYERCLQGADELWDKAAEKLIAAEHGLDQNITEAERRAIQASTQVETP